MTWWDENVDKEYQFHIREDMEILANMIIADKCESIMEFAIGSGVFIKILRDKGWEGQYIGTDYARVFLEGAKEHNPNESFMFADMNTALNHIPAKSVDACVIIHGLEYVNDYYFTLQTLKKIARRFIYLDMWQDLIDGEDKIRFNNEGGWNVNNYNKDRFFLNIKSRLGMKVVWDEVNRNERSKINRIIKLQI